MVKLTINDKSVEVPEGTTVLQAARQAGIKIPTLCYYEAIKPYGGCRLCVVEVTAGPRTSLTASCAYPVAEGIKVSTDTARVKKVRRLVIDLLWSRSPDLPILRSIANDLGVMEPSFPVGDTECILCDLCTRVCSELEQLSVIGMQGRGSKREVLTPFGELSDVCQECGACGFVCPTAWIHEVAKIQAPCTLTCPAGINVPGYISLISAGRVRDAYNLIRQDNPFPAVCGRVCTHPCESKCRRGQMDDAIAICDLKRYVADIALESDEPYKDIVFPKKGKSIGIIGAGPSGLTCGYYLARLGYDVDVYEEAPVAGGVLAFGIPEYRLPKDVLAAEIKAIEQAGVRIHTEHPIHNEKSFNELYDKHDAIYVATGTQFSRKINVQGEELTGVHHGLDFLRDVHLKQNIKIGNHVVVIGGGNTAIDTSRVAKRLGAKDVTILYRREIEDMPADRREINEAIEEGINVHTLTAPVRFAGNGKLTQVECIKMELGEFDSGGRRKPVELKGSEYVRSEERRVGKECRSRWSPYH